MFSKSKRYNLVIILIYLLFCFVIFNHHSPKSFHTHTKLKNHSAIPMEKDIIGNITIHKLGLQKPLYKIDSKKNNVDENITILKESTFPDQEKSILVMAAHSGNSNVSYFENLNKLKKSDQIKITYLNEEYTYEITTIWEEDKNGFIHIAKDNKKQLILTTCSPNHKNKQLIISSKLMKK